MIEYDEYDDDDDDDDDEYDMHLINIMFNKYTFLHLIIIYDNSFLSSSC